MFDWGRGFMFQSGEDNIVPYFIHLARVVNLVFGHLGWFFFFGYMHPICAGISKGEGIK